MFIAAARQTGVGQKKQKGSRKRRRGVTRLSMMPNLYLKLDQQSKAPRRHIYLLANLSSIQATKVFFLFSFMAPRSTKLRSDMRKLSPGNERIGTLLLLFGTAFLACKHTVLCLRQMNVWGEFVRRAMDTATFLRTDSTGCQEMCCRESATSWCCGQQRQWSSPPSSLLPP